MSEEVYQHLPRWRRIIRDLAKEAGLENLLNPPNHQTNNSTGTHDSSKAESQTKNGEKER
jgi:hypothetical protein